MSKARELAQKPNQPTGRKNLIINGAMQVAQRGTSETGVTGSGYHSLDRFQLGDNTAGTFDISQASDSPNYLFEYCYHLDVQTADTSIAAGDICHVRYYVEGKDLAHVGFGESGTRYITLSFWHKHTKTGTYCVSFVNSGNNRSYISEYTQNTSNTWEKTEVTVPVDTSGTWLTTNEIGLRINFVVASGSDWHGTADTWLSSVDFATSNQVNGLDSTSNNFKITGVQLEVGSVATDFEHRSYGEELSLCQRYYVETDFHVETPYVSGSQQYAHAPVYFPVTMRAAPSSPALTNGNTFGVATTAAYNITANGMRIEIQSSTSGRVYNLGGTLTANAEL